MITRKLEATLREAARFYPVVTVTGPRQSGKTTLCRTVFADRPYVSLEAPDTLAFVLEDPRGFLADHRGGAVIDEVQRAPALLSYLQVEVDERPEPGRFILTGSQNLSLSAGIAQSLAGRTAVLHLLPPSIEELRAFPGAVADLVTTVWHGSYPRIFDAGIPAQRWLADYVATYVQRDVRDILRVGDLSAFTAFVRLCAGRTGAELNLSTLGADAGVSHNTARSWLSVLETSFLCHRLPSWHRNTRKQLVKAPKLHFFDSGLACWLLGITAPEHLRYHPLRGALFESWVVAEAYKAHVHAGLTPRLFHWRESRGAEVDLLVERPEGPMLVEVKSGATVTPDALRAIASARAALGAGTARVVHGGEDNGIRLGVELRGWSSLDDGAWLPAMAAA